MRLAHAETMPAPPPGIKSRVLEIAVRSVISAIAITICTAVLHHAPALAEPAAPPGYEAAWSRIPAQHRALIGRVVVEQRETGMTERRGLVTHLPPGGGVGDLAHEVGHVVFWADPSMAGEWRSRFWPDGQIRGEPATGYGRQNADEDFAEAYQAMIEQGAVEDPERLAFMAGRVFAIPPLLSPPAARIEPSAPAPSSPCGGLPSGSIVVGCASVPAGSVRP